MLSDAPSTAESLPAVAMSPLPAVPADAELYPVQPSPSASSIPTAMPMPLPTLSLSLTRDQGTLHASGTGAGSEMASLSPAARDQHDAIAPIVLSYSSSFGAVNAALAATATITTATATTAAPLSGLVVNGLNGLQQDRFARGRREEDGDGNGDGSTSTSYTTSAATSISATPTPSRSPSPPPPVPATTTTAAISNPAPTKSSSSSSSATATATNATQLLHVPTSTTKTSSSSNGGKGAARPAPVEQRKSVFGKLFERSNASSTSVNISPASLNLPPPLPASTSSSTATSAQQSLLPAPSTATAAAPSPSSPSAPFSSATSPSAPSSATSAPPSTADLPPAAAPAPTSAPLVRKLSKKEKEAAAAANRPRSDSAASSPATSEKWGMGMGAALNEFMRNKVARKSSANSRKSDDGKSDRTSAHHAAKENGAGEGGSQYGGSSSKAGGGGGVAGGSGGGGGEKEETKSKSGQTTASTLKKYGVCEKVLIGKGATAVVKLAHKWDRTTERLYAVKEFRKRRKNETEKEYVKKLTSEFCISSTLHHQNIVETVDLVQDEQSHWCEVMEYCPGGDLYAAIKKGTLTPPMINSYFKQILHGVAYLHSMGVAHRDIKPENLLLDAKGHVKITDFGVSDVFRMCWEKTTHLSKGLCGSEPYIAPEQFDQKEYDARLVDVWAIAVVYYCMNFQELPWRLAKTSDPSFGPYLATYATALSPAPLGNLVPRECRAVIKKMLQPDPRKRLGVLEILAEDWVRAIPVLPKEEGLGGAPPEMGGPHVGGLINVAAAAVSPPSTSATTTTTMSATSIFPSTIAAAAAPAPAPTLAPSNASVPASAPALAPVL